MDILSSRASNITHLAMDGLLERQRAIGANIANVETPGYQRKEVAFESQLSEIIETEDLKDYIKGQNSIKPVKTKSATYDDFMRLQDAQQARRPLTIQEKQFLITNSYGKYDPQVMDDVFSEGTLDGNNVELEKEMMDLSKNGMKYVTLSGLEKKYFSGISEVIRGGGQ